MGPLTGIRIVELAGLGPTPFAAMLLADLGAEVIRIDRPAGPSLFGLSRVTCRNRRSIGLDLKHSAAIEILLHLLEASDVLIEGLRPGVAERLGIGPDICLERNPRLVYGRMTGWGQEGPLRDRAGHDINYIALSGALDSIGSDAGGPVLPLNLVGDFGGGAMYLVMGVLAALLERHASGRGQVIDAAMVDGAASLMTMIYEMKSLGFWSGSRGENLLDGGAPFYSTFETSDGRWMAVGALEPQFFAELLERLEIQSFAAADQYNREKWPELRDLLEQAFLAHTRDEWVVVFGDSDACVSPVLTMDEAPSYPFNSERGVFVEVDGVAQAAPAPRFSRSRTAGPDPAPTSGADTDDILTGLGFDAERISDLRSARAIF